MLEYVPNHSKTREICVDVVTEDQLLLRPVPGWFMVQQQLTQCDGYYDESGYIKWYDQKRKASPPAPPPPPPPSKKRRRINVHFLAPMKVVGLVYS